MDKAFQAANNDKFELAGQQFVDWYKFHAREYRFSKEFSRDIFTENQRINQVFLVHIINDKVIPGVLESSGFVYFYLNAFWLKLILQEMKERGYSDSDDPEMKEFAGFIKACFDGKGYCLVEYSKKDGWFDYEDVMRRKRAADESAGEGPKQ